MNQQKPPKKNQFNSYARYSGIVFQMLAIICFGAFIGVKLDEKFPNKNNLYTLTLSLAAVILSVIIVIRNINSASKKASNE